MCAAWVGASSLPTIPFYVSPFYVASRSSAQADGATQVAWCASVRIGWPEKWASGGNYEASDHVYIPDGQPVRAAAILTTCSGASSCDLAI